MDFYKVIESRVSIRSYDPERPIPQETLLRIINAGRLAPSAGNRQPWKFVIVSSKKLLNKIHLCYPRNWFKNAPHILIVKGTHSAAWTRQYDGYNSLETDLTITMDHMILAAKNEGLGSCWIAAFDPEILYRELELSSDEEIYAITPLGYPMKDFQEKSVKKRKPIDNIYEIL